MNSLINADSLTPRDLYSLSVASEVAIRCDYLRRHNFSIRDKSYNNFDNTADHGALAEAFFRTFLDFHDYIHQDASQRELHEGELPYKSAHLSADQRESLKQAFRQFVDRVYDESGNVRIASEEELLEALIELHNVPRNVPLRDKESTIGVFLTLLCNNEKWMKFAPHGLDFSCSAVPYAAEDSERLKQRFREALYQNHPYQFKGNEFLPLQSSYVEIGGYNFICHKVRGNWPIEEHTLLITHNGYLVDLNDELKTQLIEHLKTGTPETFTLDPREIPPAFEGIQSHLADYINPTESANRTLASLGAGVRPEEKNKIFDKAKKSAQKLREKVRKLGEMQHAIDGFPLDQKAVHFVCLEMDKLTGLSRHRDRNELGLLKSIMKRATEQEKQKAAPGEAAVKFESFADFLPSGLFNDKSANFLLIENDEEEQKLKEYMQGEIIKKTGALLAYAQNDHERSIIERASKCLVHHLPYLWKKTDQEFVKKRKHGMLKTLESKETPLGDPKFYFTHGGTASGKGRLHDFAANECGENLVTCSLDDSRPLSQEYCLYPGSDNQSDDYLRFDEFGKLAREIICLRALGLGLNTFYDCSGTPYEGRYDKLVKTFKDAGYETTMLGAYAPLYSYNEEEREALAAHGLTPGDAMQRGGMRILEERRAMPTDLIVKGHVHSPIAFMNAVQDANHLDRILLYDNTLPTDKSFILAFTIRASQQVADQLIGKGPEVLSILKENGAIPPYVQQKLPPPDFETAGNNGDDDAGKGSIKRMADFKTIHTYENGDRRLLVITDMHAYINMLQKGMLCRDTKGPDHLLKNTLAADLAGRFQAPEGRLKLLEQQAIPHRAFAPVAKVTTKRTDPLSI